MEGSYIEEDSTMGGAEASEIPGTTDNRQRVRPRRGQIHDAIAYLRMTYCAQNSMKRCQGTGFLCEAEGRLWLVTVAHNITTKLFKGLHITADTVQVYFGRDDEETPYTCVQLSGKDFYISSDYSCEMGVFDYARCDVTHLGKALPRVRFRLPRDWQDAQGRLLQVCGYPAVRAPPADLQAAGVPGWPPHSMWGSEVRQRWATCHHICYQEWTEKGNSGSPVFYKGDGDDARHYVVAIHVGHTEAMQVNMGLMIDRCFPGAVKDRMGYRVIQGQGDKRGLKTQSLTTARRFVSAPAWRGDTSAGGATNLPTDAWNSDTAERLSIGVREDGARGAAARQVSEPAGGAVDAAGTAAAATEQDRAAGRPTASELSKRPLPPIPAAARQEPAAARPPPPAARPPAPADRPPAPAARPPAPAIRPSHASGRPASPAVRPALQPVSPVPVGAAGYTLRDSNNFTVDNGDNVSALQTTIVRAKSDTFMSKIRKMFKRQDRENDTVVPVQEFRVPAPPGSTHCIIHDVCALPDRQIALCDYRHRRVVCVSLTGDPVWSTVMPDPRTATRARYVPETDSLLVITMNYLTAERATERDLQLQIHRLSLQGALQARVAPHIRRPTDLVTSQGRVYVYCASSQGIHVLNSAGEEQRRVRLQYRNPYTHLLYLSELQVFVMCCWTDSSVEGFDHTGQPNWCYRSLQEGPERLQQPMGLCRGPRRGTALLTDRDAHRVVLMVADRGTYLQDVVSEADGVKRPVAVTTTSQGVLVVAGESGRVWLFDMQERLGCS